DTRGPSFAERVASIALMATIAAGVALWVVPIASSLWLDETGTYWVIKDGLAPAIHRSLAIQGQSPLFYLLELGALRLGGLHESTLRVPSVIAMAVASVYV